MVSQADTALLRSAQAGITAEMAADLEEFFASLDLGKPEVMRNALMTFLPLLILQYGQAAATLAADWYDEVRAADSVAGRFRATVAEPVNVEARAEATVRRAMGYVFAATAVGAAVTTLSGAAGRRVPESRPDPERLARAGDLVLPALIDPSTKLVLAPARETIIGSTIADPKASGWKRITRAGSCKFCRMLAGRPDAVYKERTADFAAHGHCNCAAVPSWDPDAPEVEVQQYVASTRWEPVRVKAAEGDKKAIKQLADHRARMRKYLEKIPDEDD